MTLPDTTATPPTPRQLRAELSELVDGELLGPANGPHEEVDESILDRYLVGLLAPPRQAVPETEDEDLADDGPESAEEGRGESSGVRAGSLVPSSMGLSFVVSPGVDRVEVRASWGQYSRAKSEEILTDKGNPKTVWKRTPRGGAWVELTLVEGPLAGFQVDPQCPGVHVRGLARRLDGRWVVTLFLVNDSPHLGDGERTGTNWLFQAELGVRGVDGASVFERRPGGPSGGGAQELVQEEEEMALGHRRTGEFAVGHGVAVEVTVDPEDPWKASAVRTRAIPRHELPASSPPTSQDPGFERLAELELDMKVLADESELVRSLTPLVEAYSEWIDREEARLGHPEERLEGFGDAPDRVISKCRRSLERLREGVELLGKDEDAARAFRFANRAMWLQRVRSILAEKRRRGGDVTFEEVDAEPSNHSWRPFQLAFLLINLPSSTDLHHPDRSHSTDAVADLLWFPTGGGKTEAYLGLAAYTLGLRRLRGVVEGRPGDHGVSVLMRYTLRLLTLQQFQRAAALICACESIRRQDPRTWKDAVFRIGIWVGARTTPNWTHDSAEWVQQQRGGGRPQQGNVGSGGSPHQLTNCPWCGTSIDPGKNITVETVKGGRGRTLVMCGDRDCEFNSRNSPKEGLPILVTDEEIYRLLPSLLIATVDKFAQMPWNGRTQMLFGQVDEHCPRHGFRTADVADESSHRAMRGMPATTTTEHPDLQPPDLIVQDELHLIAGPLGSLVGLYETAVDELCTWQVDGKRVRPKVVASTATIRNAAHQARSLFLRKVEVFPPQGLDVRDNFFSLQRQPSDETPGRLYLGICAPGRKLKVALIRVYMAYLAAAQTLYVKYGKDADAWMTLVGYFNSIRELGGMRRLVDDDVASRLKKMGLHGLAVRYLEETSTKELTSRMSSTQVPETLDHLEAVFDPALEDQRKEDMKAGRGPRSRRPIDVLLATNMISVGVDVARLGLMVVAGQPKGTAEYIQATSRVGRRHPGIVCTVYNWSRPRDLSHFERFEHYHATFYQQVEALSVTPFAARALDRGLAALVVSMVRLSGPRYNGNATAGTLSEEEALVDAVVERVSDRVSSVLGSASAGQDAKERARRIADEWLAETRKPQLVYRERESNDIGLLSRPETEDWRTFTCLNSLRDVEPSPGLVLLEDGSEHGS